MMNFFIYLMKANICLVAFYLLYIICFRNSSFFKLNRFYLLAGICLSLLLPLLHFSVASISRAIPVSEEMFDSYPEVLMNTPGAVTIVKPSFPTGEFLAIAYFLISSFFIFRFFYSLIRIIRLIREPNRTTVGNLIVFSNPALKHSFSFFHYIFLDESDISKGRTSVILDHERVHANQLHTFDLIFLELTCFILWINPFFFLYRRDLQLQHEYLADSGVIIKTNNLTGYINSLAFRVPAFTNSVLMSPYNKFSLKKRIYMLTSPPSSPVTGIRYFLFIPVLTFLFYFISCSSEENSETQPLAKAALQKDQDLNTPSILPLKKELIGATSGYGFRIHPIYKIKKFHPAYDFVAPEGSEIFATADGIVESVQFSKWGFGNMVTIQHGKYKTRYAHMAKITVKEWQYVSKGQVIGTVGSSGLSTCPHLHYEVYYEGEAVNPAYFYRLDGTLSILAAD